METIKHSIYSDRSISMRHKKTNRRIFERVWLACAQCIGGIRKFVGRYLPLQSIYDEYGAKPTASQRFAITARIVPIIGVFMFFLTAIAFHCYKILVIRHPEFEAKTNSHCKLIQNTKGTRGCIYTIDEKLLAGNYFQKDIYIEPKKIPSKYRSEIYKLLADATHRPEHEIARQFFDIIYKDLNITLSSDVDFRTAQLIKNRQFPHTTVTMNTPRRSKKDPTRLPYTSYTVTFTLPFKQQLEKYMPTLNEIGSLLNMSDKALKKRIEGRHGFNRIKQIKIQSGIDFPDGVAFENKMKKFKHMGQGAFTVETHCKRIHPQNELAAPFIGLISMDKGISGIEELFDEQLQPTDGKRVILKDGTGTPIPLSKTLKTIQPINGNDIYLTINSVIQSIMEEELSAAIPSVNPDRAYVLMMKPQTGAIMALAQYPTFDPNKRSEVEDPSAFGFLPLTETFEPGSIMKGISLACGISEGIFDLNSVYFCENGYWPSARLHDTHRNENLSITEIIMHSSNIGTAKAAIDLGAYKLFAGLTKFGFGKETHVGFYPAYEEPTFFKCETKGIFRSLERWDSLSITRFPIGQGISVTPFQMVQAYSAIANNGTMMQPYIIDHMVSQDGTVTKSIPRIKGHPISSRAARQMTEALKTVPTKTGTARRAAIEGYTVAGKTGTSQIWVTPEGSRGYYDTQKVVASFIGFAPADAPEFVLLVTFVNPKPKRHGGTIAGPVFSKIGERTLAYLQIPPEKQEENPQEATVQKR